MTLPLISASDCQGEIHLLVGTNALSVCMNRVRTIEGSGAIPVVVNVTRKEDVKNLLSCEGVQIMDREFQLADLTTLGRSLVARVVDRVFVNLPMTKSPLQREIYEQCVKLRIPINCYQRPEYSTFHMISTYTDPKGSGLQIAVTTNGQGCILANRIKREMLSHLPANISEVVTNMGRLRDQIINEDQRALLEHNYGNTAALAIAENNWYGLNDEDWESHKLNKLVEEFAMTERDQKLRRTRWLSQVMEYYPLAKLAELDLQALDLPAEATSGKTQTSNAQESAPKTSQEVHSQNVRPDLTVAAVEATKTTASYGHGTISLVGSGPGSVSMLTLGALSEIKNADYILADKLVPQPVLDLIPNGTETFIARKFPGNAERAQQELLEKGLEALEQGKKVVRLKQGDPYIFGRGGEEYLFFKERGFEPQVLPGLSSSLASTVTAKIPATQRDVADQILVCTGTGRKGALPKIPEYVVTRTTVFLMALHRAEVLVEELLKHQWDENVPAAIIERASCKDQRITRTLLKYVPQVVEEIGSRPPGLLVVGRAVTALLPQELTHFNDSRKYYVEEGFEETSQNLGSLLQCI